MKKNKAGKGTETQESDKPQSYSQDPNSGLLSTIGQGLLLS